ncbi:XVIPCD domain-containing protein [Lysobacter enzymogenes]|uniref:XVIPCD domain-containing protein n=1 Tax=Lysobacter enzymogenes TaxID=69 RepID=UPI00384D548B
MARPNSQLEAAIARLQYSPGTDPSQVAALRAAIRADDDLLDSLNDAARQGRLSGFASSAQEPVHSIGRYDMASGVVTLPSAALAGQGGASSADLTAILKLQDMTVRLSQQTYVDQAGGRAAVSQTMVNHLQQTINESPVLAKELRAAAVAEPNPHLKNFAFLDPSFGAGGTYDGDTKTMNLPAARLLPKGPGNQLGFNPDSLTFVIAHEVQHGFNHQGKREAYKVFDREVRDIARDKDPINDYTPPISKLIQAGREDEARAEIAGWNAVLSRTQNIGRVEKLDDMLSSKASQVRDFVERDAARNVVPVGGLSFNADFSLEPSAANIAAMGRNYFDKMPAHTPGVPEAKTSSLGPHNEADYPNYYGRNAVERAITIDRQHAHAVGGVEPQMHINMGQLRLDERLIERLGLEIDPRPQERQAYYDTSQSPPALRHFDHTKTGPGLNQHIPIDPAVLAEDPIVKDRREPTPAQPGHPDHPLYTQIADQVRFQDQKHGRQWDEASERMTASLLALAKEQGLAKVDHVVFSARTGQVAAGENVFIVQGRLDDPASLRAHMKTDDATRTPERASFEKVAAINEQMALEPSPTQQAAQSQGQDVQSPVVRGR